MECKRLKLLKVLKSAGSELDAYLSCDFVENFKSRSVVKTVSFLQRRNCTSYCYFLVGDRCVFPCALSRYSMSNDFILSYHGLKNGLFRSCELKEFLKIKKSRVFLRKIVCKVARYLLAIVTPFWFLINKYHI